MRRILQTWPLLIIIYFDPYNLSEFQFKSVEQMQESLDEFTELKPPSFFRSGIRQLPER